MPKKNIIVLMDGTWDSLDDKALSNVAKLRDLLIEKTDRQIFYYDDGVGANALGVSKLIDGATGLGIDDKIIQGYQFIMQNYNPNDNICLFGFSRGAYTVRFIADFIAHVGLLKFTPDETQAAQFTRVNEYFNLYKEQRYSNTIAIDPQIANVCTIEMIGVWDTVASLGIPLDLLKSFDKKMYEFNDKILPSSVLNAYQALAIDEKREDFIPCIWNNRDRILQVWFSGVHADIGGGYNNCGLANITLKWLLQIAIIQHNLLIDIDKYDLIEPNSLAKLHNSAEIFPFNILPTKARVIPNDSLISTSVQNRIKDIELKYNPANLPQEFTWEEITSIYKEISAISSN